MVAFLVYQIVCFCVVTHTYGMLSEHKLCGDTECESRISRVQAIQDHFSKDCRFLTFRQGDIIFVYHKLTGEREDLWAGSIDRKFGYFPKDFVKEEEIYTTAEKVLETQPSDFFCIDENGYPIDASELDYNVNTHLPDTAQTVQAASQSFPQESHQTRVNTNTKSGQEADKTEVETEGWLTSSVTGLWEFVQKDDTSITKKDNEEEMGDESSLTSSVTGWLGFGAKLNGGNREKTDVEQTKTTVFLGSSMTEWLSFRSNSKADEKYSETPAKMAQEDNSMEVFRGRKIDFDLQQDSQFTSDETEENKKLDWLGRQESGSDETEKDPKPISSSWFNVDISDMLGFGGGAAEQTNQMQKNVADAAPNILSLKQADEIEMKVIQTEAKISSDTSLDTNLKEINEDNNGNKDGIDAQLNISGDSDQKQRRDNLLSPELSSNGNELTQMSSEEVKIKDSKNNAIENTVMSTNYVSTQEHQDSLQLEQNHIKPKTVPQSEYMSHKVTQSGSSIEMFETEVSKQEGESNQKGSDDLHHSKVSETEDIGSVMGLDMQDESEEENQEDIDGTNTAYDVQEVINEKPDKSVELTDTKPGDVREERPQDTFQMEEIEGAKQKSEHSTQIKIYLEPQSDTEVDKEEKGSKVDVLNGEKQHFEELSAEERVEEIPLQISPKSEGELRDNTIQELMTEKSQLDEATQAPNDANNPDLISIQKSIKDNPDATNDVQNMQILVEMNSKLDEDTSQPLLMAPSDIDRKVDSTSFKDRQDAVSNHNHEVSGTKLQDEIHSYSKNTQASEIGELYNQRDGDSDVRKQNSEKNDQILAGNEISETDSSTGVDTERGELEDAALQNVLNETFVFVPYEGMTSSVMNDEDQYEKSEVFGHSMNRSQLSVNNETADLNPETETEMSHDNVLIKEDDILNEDKDVQMAMHFPHVRSAITTTQNRNTLHQLYPNIFYFINTNELEILIYYFGDHKMQFLEYILGSLDTARDDADTSILLDIKTILNYHMERLMPTCNRGNPILKEDDECSYLTALLKLELVLEKVNKAFNMINDVQEVQDQDIWIHRDNKINDDMDDKHETLRSIHATLELIAWLLVQVVSALPDDMRPGPDLYGVPWEPIIISGFVGLVTILVFICRCYSSVKSRLYQNQERGMAEQVAQLLDEKCKVLETLSKVQQEYNGIEDSLRDSGVLAQTQKTIQLEAKAKQLECAKKAFESDFEQLKDQLNQQREHRLEQEQRITALEESIKTGQEETKIFQSQEEQGQTTLKVYSMNSDRLQRNLETAGEENTLLQENNTHLRQQLEGWAERVSELEEEMRRCEYSHRGMLQDVATKEERIMSLTDRILQFKAWDSDLGGEQGNEVEKEISNGTAASGETNGTREASTDQQGHLQKVQKLIHAAKLNADLKTVDEDKDRIFAKLNDEVKAKEDLQGSIKALENEKASLHSDTMHHTDQVQVLHQKLQIMTEMYQENELKLHRLLTVEEKERLQKEEKLTKADKNIAMAMEELNNYRQRAGEMEDELEKTKQSYQTQISSHEKKAHNNWLAARAAERELAEIRRENALLRQKLTDTQFKLETIEKDPYALDSLARPLPYRAESSPYGPSPLGRPGSETRAFLSPPTLMDGPPNRLSPRVMRGPLEPPVGSGVTERTGGPHSDSGSISPIWEGDRRGPPPGSLSGPLPVHPGTMAPPGYIFPDAGGPMYRRPPPGTMSLHPPPGPLPPRGSRLPGPPGDMADRSYRENSLGPGEHEHREPGASERKTPPESDPRMGAMAPLGPSMVPIDGPFSRRMPYGAPSPEYYLPRGPGVPPIPVWGPPPGMMYPPRFPPGGPPPPHMPLYAGPTVHPPFSDEHPPLSTGPPQPPLAAPIQRQPSQEHTPSPQDII